jgi:hypothetical protein
MAESKRSESTPPDGDPSWPERCRPLLLLLREAPRTHAELAAWRKTAKVSTHMLTQMLAWCDNRKLVGFRGKRWWLGRYRTDESDARE